MADRPLLIFPSPGQTPRNKLHGFPSKPPHMPTIGRQVERTRPMFATLQGVLDGHRARLTESPIGAEAETILVLETIGRVDEFQKAVKYIPGLEWLGDQDEDNIIPDDDFYEESDKDRVLDGRLYLMIANLQALEQLISLWNEWSTQPNDFRFPRGLAKLRDAFEKLSRIRKWGPEDRLFETGLREEWEARQAEGKETLLVEIELVCRDNPGKRAQAVAEIKTLVEEVGGTVLNEEAFFPQISYHAILAELPIRYVGTLFTNDTQLVRSESIMFLRPTSQMAVVSPEPDLIPSGDVSRPQPNLLERPVAALLDGLPQENHRLLADRLIVDTEGDWAEAHPALERVHGTAMASLILHGELDEDERPLNHLLYIRPILQPDPSDFVNKPRWEKMPERKLPVSVIYDAVRRMFEGISPSVGPAAPNVHFINLSVGDLSRPFGHFPSPLARLLDWLSWHYNVLFIISAGNHSGTILFDVAQEDFDTLLATPSELSRSALRYINDDTRNRRLLSPAESINGVTVGALHHDASENALPGILFDPLNNPFEPDTVPSPVSAHGPGFNQAIKPEVLTDGGRLPYMKGMLAPAIVPSPTTSATGQRVAAPAPLGSTLMDTCYRSGTSNATALTTRYAVQLYDVLRSLRQDSTGDSLPPDYLPVLVKALLAHSASWEGRQGRLDRELGGIKKPGLQRLLGYGGLRIERVMSCLDQRATLLGWGQLRHEEGHVYSLPIPDCLNAIPEQRTLTITLAWFSPINSKHQSYRQAELWFEPNDEANVDPAIMRVLRVDRKEADGHAVRRGTLQHEILGGDKIPAFSEGDELKIQVNCRLVAGGNLEYVRYGLAVTLETKNILPIYEEIQTRLHVRIPVFP
jgi:Subtilase family